MAGNLGEKTSATLPSRIHLVKRGFGALVKVMLELGVTGCEWYWPPGELPARRWYLPLRGALRRLWTAMVRLGSGVTMR